MRQRAQSVAIVVLAAVLLGGGAAPASAQPTGPSTGDAGGGDPYFPVAGNGGYDVRL